MKKAFFVFAMVLTFGLSAQNCTAIHTGVFKYAEGESDDITAIVVFKKKMHYEYYENKKYVLKSKLVWLSDCEYEVTVVKNTSPQMAAIKKGVKMRVKIDKIEGKDIYYTATLNTDSFKGHFVKMD